MLHKSKLNLQFNYSIGSNLTAQIAWVTAQVRFSTHEWEKINCLLLMQLGICTCEENHILC